MTEIEIALLKQKVEDFDLQLKRFSSHLESERRGQVETGKRVDQIVTTTKQMIDTVNKLDNILRNGNGGLQLRVDRIEQREESSKWRLTMWLSIASGAVGIISLIMQLRDKI